MIKRISKQQLLVVGLAAGGLLLGLIGYVGLVAPQKSQAGKLDSEIQTAQRQLVKAKRTPKVKGASVGAADLFRLTKAMPDSDDVPGLLIQLDGLAKASRVTLVSLRPEPTEPAAEGYSAMPLQVVVSGKYAAVTEFLQRLRDTVSVTHGRLEASGRLFVTNKLSLSSSDGRTVSASLDLDAFVYGTEAPLASTAGPSTGTPSSTPATGSAG